MQESFNALQKNEARYGGFRKQSMLFTDHEQYLLGITNEQLYGGDINVSESLEANLSVDDAFAAISKLF